MTMKNKINFLRGLERLTQETIEDISKPVNLDQAHRALMVLLHPEDLEAIQSDPDEGMMIQLHHGLGQWIRNNWDLWKKGPLHKWFVDNHGVDHPDDISSIILDTFWCKLHNKDFQLTQRCSFYKDYWNLARSDRKNEAYRMRIETYLAN